MTAHPLYEQFLVSPTNLIPESVDACDVAGNTGKTDLL